MGDRSDGMGFFGSKVTSRQTPWDPAQKSLKLGLKEADRLYKSGSGFNPYEGNRVAGYGADTLGALSDMSSYASGPNPFGSARNVINSQMTGPGITTGAQYGQLANQGVRNNARKYLKDVARGDHIGQGDANFQSALDYQVQQGVDATNRTFGVAGRYGSASHGKGVMQEAGQMRRVAMENQRRADEARQMQAVQLIAQGDQAGYQSKLGALSGQTGVQAQNLQNRYNASMSAADVYQAGLAPAMLKASVGQAKDALSQEQINAQMAKHNEQQMAEWSRLNAQQQIAGQAGGMGGDVRAPKTPIKTAAGMALQTLPFIPGLN
jgi:ribosomal protein L11